MSIKKIENRGFPGGASGKEPTCQCRRCKRHRFDPWVKNIPWSRKWQPTPVFLPGAFHGQRGLAGYNPWGFSWKEYWSGLPCPPPGDLPDPGIEPKCLASPALVGRFFTTSRHLGSPNLSSKSL